MLMKRSHGVLYYAYSHGSYFYIHTNEGAKNFKVFKTPVEDPCNTELWEDVLPHREDVFVKSINLFRHHFVAWEFENGFQKIRVQDLSDGEVHYVHLNESVYTLTPGIHALDDFSNNYTQTFNSNLLRFTYTSFGIIFPFLVLNHFFYSTTCHCL